MADETNATPAAEAPAPTTPPESLLNAAAETPPVEATPAQAETEKSPTEETKPAEAAPALDVSALKVPEGVELAEGWQDRFKESMGELGISDPEKAQKALDIYTKELTEAGTKPYALWAKTQTEWQDAVKADKEIGGDALQSTVLPTIAKVLDQYGTPEVRAAFAFTGAGNNPEIVRTLYRMSKALTEGGHVAGSPASKPQGTGAHALYPDLT